MTFVPSHQIVGSTQPEAPTAFVLHGLLGSRQNWRSFATRLVARHPQWQFVLIDQRHHGQSQGAPAPDTITACAADLNQLAHALGREPQVVLGHSFGGKVALTYAQNHGDTLRCVWVIDTPPGLSSPDEKNTIDAHPERVISALRQLPEVLPKRKSLVDAITEMGLPRRIGLWLTTNLEWSDAGYRMRLQLEGVEALLRSHRNTDLWPILETPPAGVQVCVVRAVESAAWSESDIARLNQIASMGTIQTVNVENAGHWVHTDNPTALENALISTFENPGKSIIIETRSDS